MENLEKKGIVTSLASIFPPEEAQKASKRVLDAIADRQKELDQLQHFISDNNNLLTLVQELPEQLHHDIMVPFGKAAFFPGRLVHTNEFLVLLGEGYYADRTSKQTTEILNRRGNALESHVESLKAVMKDLKAEASFFDGTAAEAAEGLVEITEDYIEESSSEKVPQTDNKRAAVEDEEYARLFSRMEELEKEELEAGAEDDNEDELDESDSEDRLSHLSVNHQVKHSEVQQLSKSLEESRDVYSTRKLEDHLKQDYPDHLNREAVKVQPASKGQSSNNVSKDGHSQEARTAFSKPSVSDKELKANLQQSPKSEDSVLSYEAHSNSSEAFTGSIVEHTHNIDKNPREEAAASTSKKVSRFKMQRNQH